MLDLIWLLFLTLQVKTKMFALMDSFLCLSSGQTRHLSPIKQARMIKTQLSEQQHDRLIIPTEVQRPKIYISQSKTL